MKKIVLTGSTGFLGSTLTSRLNAEGLETVGIIRGDSRGGDRVTYAKENVYFSEVNELSDLVDWSQIGAIIHLATSYGRGDSLAVETCNVELPKKLLSLSQSFGVTSFLNADSFFSDVDISYPYLKEYRESKRRFREFARVSAESHHTKIINLRIFHMYGPHDKPGKFVHDMLTSIRGNETEIFLTDGQQRRDFIHVEDVANAFICVLRNVNRIEGQFRSFDVGTNNLVSIKSFLNEMKALCRSDTQLSYGVLPTRQGESLLDNVMSDNNELISLGWAPKFNYIDGLSNIIDSLKGG